MKANDAEKTVVFSGVNFTDGGPLSIYKDAVNCFLSSYPNQFKVLLLVNNQELFRDYWGLKNVEIKEYKMPKKSYLNRLFFEWVTCKSLSNKIKPFLWFALHDITPNVTATKRVVYCHNPSPFYSISFKDILFDKVFFLHTLVYDFFYSIKIRKNDYVIVQQNWIKVAFEKRYNINNVIVAHPDFHIPQIHTTENSNDCFTFFYPSFPRVFKNFETLFQACEILSKSNCEFQLIVTISGKENKYAKSLFKQFGHLKQVKFVGLQSRSDVLQMIKNADCVVFPSKLETWGLPLTEARHFGKLILAADLPYAHETLEGYSKKQFFSPTSPQELSLLMHNAISKDLDLSSVHTSIQQFQYLEGWNNLFNYILR